MSKESQNRDTDSGRQGEGEILCKQRGLEDNRIKAMNCWTTCSHEDWRHKRCLIQLCNAGNNAVLSGKRQRPEGEEGASDDDTAGWQHQPDGHELGQTLGDGEGQGGLACCRPWGHRVGHNWVTEKQHSLKRVCLWHMAWLTSAFWMEYFSFFPFNFLSHISSPCYLYFLMDILSIYNIPSIFQPASVSRHWKDTFSVSSEKIRTK